MLPTNLLTFASFTLTAPLGGNQIAVAHDSSPFISAYPFSAGFGTKYADPGTLPVGRGYGVAFNSDSIAVGHQSSPSITAYPFSAGFGTKYANPATLFTNDGRGIAFG